MKHFILSAVFSLVALTAKADIEYVINGHSLHMNEQGIWIDGGELIPYCNSNFWWFSVAATLKTNATWVREASDGETSCLRVEINYDLRNFNHHDRERRTLKYCESKIIDNGAETDLSKKVDHAKLVASVIRTICPAEPKAKQKISEQLMTPKKVISRQQAPGEPKLKRRIE